MQYTVNLYKADANGSFVAKAYTQSASQRPVYDNHTGVCTRDTRLQDAQMPQWENRPDSAFAVSLAHTFFFVKAAPNKTLGNCALLLNDIKALRSLANNTPLDLSALAKGVQDKGGCFLDAVMSYPRWVKYDGGIQVGGMFYFGKLDDDEGKRFSEICGKQCVRVATVAERETAFLDALVGRNGFVAPDAYAERDRYARGSIDEIVAQFRCMISELGQKACCNSVALQLNAKIDSLVELLGSCGINDFLTLETVCYAAEDALSAFSLAIAAKQDAAAQAPVDGYTDADRKRDEETRKAAQTAADNAAIAAARKVKELKGKSAGGRKGAAIAKTERGKDKERKAILDEAKKLLKEWDVRYPDRHKPPRDAQHSDNAAFRIVANKHKGADGKPVMSAAIIGRTLRREKAKNEKRGKYPRTGKKRGKYKAQT